jgi:2''-aminoglycoside nucleotidyltransferase
MHTADQVTLIHELLADAEWQELPLWLESGWAIEARLQRESREHGDIDLAFPAERRAEFQSLLRSFGCGSFEKTDYGFLVHVRGVLLDCEPCIRTNGAYELEGTPPGSCPWDKQGTIAGVAVRCTSWEAILWEYLHYLDEVPLTSWRPKDFAGYASACRELGDPAVKQLRQAFAATKNASITRQTVPK